MHKFVMATSRSCRFITFFADMIVFIVKESRLGSGHCVSLASRPCGSPQYTEERDCVHVTAIRRWQQHCGVTTLSCMVCWPCSENTGPPC